MKPRRKPWILSARRWAPLLAGGMALQFNLTGCDPEVRDSILTGVQSSLTAFITSLINAFFTSFQDGGATTQPMARAIFDTASIWLA